MVKNFNLGIALAFVFIAFSTSVALVGCKKQTNIQIEKISDEQIIDAILDTKEYAEINKNLIKIIELSKNNSGVKVSTEDLNLVVKNIKSISELTKFLKELGIVKYDEIVELNMQNFNLFQKIITGIPGFENKTINQISSLFNKAYIENERNFTKGERLKYVTMDICSSAYTIGLKSCDDKLTIDLASAALAGVVGTLAGSPPSGAALYFGGIAIAYMQETSCRQNVLNEWINCRKEHPIN
jgi:hypothetical protein